MRSKVYGFSSIGGTEKTVTLAVKKSESKRILAPTFAFDPPPGLTVRAIKNADGEFFAYCDDGKVYRKTADGYAIASQETFDSAPDIVEITVTGEKRFLLIGENECAITGEAEPLDVSIKGDCYAVFAGMLFVATGRTIRFSAPFDFTNFSVNLELGGYYEVEARDGNVRYMTEKNGKLCVVCERSIVYLEVFGDRTDYRAERLQVGYLNVVKRSAVKIGETIYFITNGKLAALNSSLKTYDVLYKDAVKNAGKAHTAAGYYLLSFSSGGKNKTLYCDTDGDAFAANAADCGGDICDGGIFYDSEKGGFYAFAENAETVAGDVMQSDLGACELKTVTGASLCCDGDGYLTVSGDFGEKTFALKKGCNVVKCNLVSRRFSFSQTGAFADEIKIKYRIHGEL